MIIKKFIAGMCAAAAACCIALPAAAEADTGDTANYGKAGIVWMIKDYWDHRNTVESEPLDELENNVISCTHTDVNITGNGQYEVILEGYHVVEDQIPFTAVGTLGVEFAMDFDKYEDVATFTLDECTIDGVTYTFNEQPPLEESELGKVMKVKNAYGENAKTTPEMDANPWTTTDPISIKFTVSGLETDKIEDNPDEQIVTAYGNGSIENDPAEDDALPSEAAETEESSAADKADADTGTETPDADTESKTDSDDSKAEVEEKGSPYTIYICIAGGVVVVIVVIALVAKKKK